MKPRILLVHDNLPIVLALKTVLERDDYLVAIANSQTEAEEKLAADVFDLVITDLQLDGEIKGYDVLQVARKLPSQPTVAFLTAFPEVGTAMDASAIHPVVKPSNEQEFLRQVEKMIVTHRGYVWVN